MIDDPLEQPLFNLPDAPTASGVAKSEGFATNADKLDHTPLDFGKYRGKTPNEVAEINPGYIVWMFENVDRETCSQLLYLECGGDVGEEDE